MVLASFVFGRKSFLPFRVFFLRTEVIAFLAKVFGLKNRKIVTARYGIIGVNVPLAVADTEGSQGACPPRSPRPNFAVALSL